MLHQGKKALFPEKKINIHLWWIQGLAFFFLAVGTISVNENYEKLFLHLNVALF